MGGSRHLYGSASEYNMSRKVETMDSSNLIRHQTDHAHTRSMVYKKHQENWTRPCFIMFFLYSYSHTACTTSVELCRFS